MTNRLLIKNLLDYADLDAEATIVVHHRDADMVSTRTSTAIVRMVSAMGRMFVEGCEIQQSLQPNDGRAT